MVKGFVEEIHVTDSIEKNKINYFGYFYLYKSLTLGSAK